jgi:hypothetical protein
MAKHDSSIKIHHQLIGVYGEGILQVQRARRWSRKSHNGTAKVKRSHYRPWGFQKADAPRFQDNRHMKAVRLSALRTGCLYPHEIFLVIRAIVRPEQLCQWKNPVTPLGIDPATFQFVAQCLNHYATTCPLTMVRHLQKWLGKKMWLINQS